MEKHLSQDEIDRRFAEIRTAEPETMTAEEASSLKAAEEVDGGSSVSQEEFKRGLEEFSGKLVLRIPRSLHKALKEQAEIEGVSLNQYMLYKLAR